MQAEEQFTRLEGLGDIVIHTSFKAFDAVRCFRSRGQHADRHVTGLFEVSGQREAAFAGHHDVEDDEIKTEPAHGGAGGGGVGGGRDTEAVFEQIARQQIADALVVVNYKHMRGVIGERLRRDGEVDSVRLAGSGGVGSVSSLGADYRALMRIAFEAWR